ncbi:2-dehydro-3-deoxygalactonokinase [Pokkaliibacter sp. CJK22405]|uniref:2-dehydro-3-deoxygalactonokinase n=1 Tax=Pokkaliibacter sp. CJK22405 TaxID=3384615 RepID=UPI003984A28B
MLEGLHWIAADWGTSALRVWGMDAQANVLAHRHSDQGMGKLRSGDYTQALLSLIEDWLPESAPSPFRVVICGMAGARQGWIEAPYRQVPCTPVDWRESVQAPCPDPRLAVRILPGLSQLTPADVMRGEETQIAGWLLEAGTADAVLCLPGTHSKWVDVRAGEVQRFVTYMTGEHYALLAEQSVLRHSLTDEAAAPALPTEVSDNVFIDAVRHVLDAPERFCAGLFSLRARHLLQGEGASTLRARLSGWVIGVELAASRQWWQSRDVILIGNPALARRYQLALDTAGGKGILADGEELALAGLCAAWKHSAA